MVWKVTRVERVWRVEKVEQGRSWMLYLQSSILNPRSHILGAQPGFSIILFTILALLGFRIRDGEVCGKTGFMTSLGSRFRGNDR